MDHKSFFPIQALKHFFTLKGYFSENWRALAIGLLSLLVVDFLQLLIPLVIKDAVDLLTTGQATALLLLRQGLFIIIIALLIAIFRYLWRYLIFGHSRLVEEKLRNRLYQHLQRLPLSFYQKTKTGDLMARSINDLNAIRMATGMGLVALTDGTVLGLAAIGFMISINLKLAMISLIPAPIVVILTRIFTRQMSLGFEKVQKTFSDLTERVREAFSGIRVIKAYGREQWELERVKQEGKIYIQHNLTLARSLALFFPMMAIFTNTGLAIVIWMGGRLAILGDITTGEFVAFTSYLNLLTWPMMAMGWVTNLIQRGGTSIQRINSILEQRPEFSVSAKPASVNQPEGLIEIKNLCIRYDKTSEPVLSDIRLTIQPGETIAIVGPVASGKTTLLLTIPRIIDPPVGSIFLDGNEIHSIPLESLRLHMGFVTQETSIFSDTIRNNIVFGREGIDELDIEKALRIARIDEEIMELPERLDTILGEKGITLSGGQRQRLTIARALVGNPPVLILDDSFSMVDINTEKNILENILEYRRNKTNIIVSHRVTTLSRATKIIVLDKGRLVEQGTHWELITKGGLYAKLYERQKIAEELEINT